MMKGTLNDNGRLTLEALSQMTQNHTISYRFDGMMEIGFECDSRIIVLSTSPVNEKSNTNVSGSRLLPCSLTVCLKAFKPKVNDGDNEGCMIPPLILTRIRHFITRCGVKELATFVYPRNCFKGHSMILCSAEKETDASYRITKLQDQK